MASLPKCSLLGQLIQWNREQRYCDSSPQYSDETDDRTHHSPSYCDDDVRQKKRQEKSRQKVLAGRCSQTVGRFRGAPQAARYIFIYRVMNDTMAVDITEKVNLYK